MIALVIVLQLLLLAYHRVNGLVMAVPAIGFIFDIHWMKVTSLIIYPVLLVGEYLNWWKHYFFRPSQKWIETYNRIFKETIIVLPPVKGNPIPNLEHTILHGVTLLTTIVTYIYFFSL